ncbi:helix-turn-helix domain-containing protein [Saccharospirillum salsuginis]|uniref:Transcriptional regulator n=1 Tax=Saccharospirillum salsuginis TaxID=418750 RepID=A0A918NJC2_9GAMM|nr:S24 family peptidase [Saccharospirillum salsuginis]GGX72030.1 transcriptional regulator [Saccharospirillum salsuginis]
MTNVGTRIRETRKKAKLSQAELASRCGWKEMQTRISSYEHNRTEPSYRDMEKIALALGVNASWLAFDQGPVTGQVREQRAEVDEHAVAGETDDSYSSSADALIAIPYLVETDTDKPADQTVTLDGNGPMLRFAKAALRRAGVPKEYAAAAHISGNAMAPYLPDGALVGVDTSTTKVTDGNLYAIDHGGLMKIRVAYRIPGGLRLKAYNDAEHPEERYTGDALTELRILGRVFWYSVLL